MISVSPNIFNVEELTIKDLLIWGDMNLLARFVCSAYMSYVVLPESYISKYILIKLEDSTIDQPIYSSNHEDLDYPEPKEEVKELLKDDKIISNRNERRLYQQNINSSFRMFVEGISRSKTGKYQS